MGGILEKPELGPMRVQLRPYQEEAINAARREFCDNRRRSTLIVLPTGCHDPGQGIRMFDGSMRAAGDVRVGDQLASWDERPRNVLQLHEGWRDRFEIVPARGVPFVVTDDHLVTVYSQIVHQIVDMPARDLVALTPCEREAYLLLRGKIGSLAAVEFNIRQAKRGFYSGFTVDADHRYSLEDGILTHNCGKTVVFGSIARRCVERGGRVLILAHREELIEQAVNKLDMLGVEVGVEKAQSRARALFDPDVVVATVQTMQRKRLESWPRDHFRLIITDESHHAIGASYQRIYKHFGSALHLGVTATADRADEENLGSVFESVAYEMTLWDAMTAPPPGPYLSRLKFVQCDVDIDLRGIRTTAGDFNAGDLEERIRPMIETLANAIRQEAGGRKTLVFTPDVGSAQAMATALASFGLRADWVAGDDNERRSKVERFQNGDIQILVNCMLLVEGFDCPDVSAVALCRPTKSRPLYAQIVGRGTRLAPNKSDCKLIDFNYLTAKHDLVRPVELFDSSQMDARALDYAQDYAKKNPGVDLMEAIEKGKQEKERRTILKIKARERDVKYRKVSYDPLSVYETMGIPWRGSKDAVVKRATEAQVALLKKFGVDDASNLSVNRASTLIDYNRDRMKKGLATVKQVTHLIANGVDPARARAMKINEASEYLSSLWGERA